ncbi:MAG: response regulator [Chloroflexi bacterium]|nr:response regulator [Chloroflexota bacterium]
MNREQWNALVVEDEIDSMELVCEVLEYHGIRSLAAYDANQALEILKDTIPTVIIIDLQLPGMDGWSLLREIQQDAHLNHVPRVAMTAYHSVEVSKQSLKAGFDAYFPKPIETRSFVEQLSQIVRR